MAEYSVYSAEMPLSAADFMPVDVEKIAADFGIRLDGYAARRAQQRDDWEVIMSFEAATKLHAMISYDAYEQLMSM